MWGTNFGLKFGKFRENFHFKIICKIINVFQFLIRFQVEDFGIFFIRSTVPNFCKKEKKHENSTQLDYGLKMLLWILKHGKHLFNISEYLEKFTLNNLSLHNIFQFSLQFHLKNFIKGKLTRKIWNIHHIKQILFNLILEILPFTSQN